MNYPLSPQSVFPTIQGEGSLSGLPTVFVRFAGCDVGCPECDTDYGVDSRATVDEIVRRVLSAATPATQWVWLTGGEPTIHDLEPLVGRLRSVGFRVALATAGKRAVTRDRSITPPAQKSAVGFDFVSVSPHGVDGWVQRAGDQVNLVPGLNGLRLADFDDVDFGNFTEKWVTPIWYGPCDHQERVTECVDWVNNHRGWRLGSQNHKHWGLP